MDAIILAGGLGTRLRSVVADVPKVMAPIGDKPFLHFILEYLYKHGVKRVVLSVGYKSTVISDYFGSKFKDIELVYCIENEPLGTGGAIKKAFNYVESENAFIINGDTFFNVSLDELKKTHLNSSAKLTLALKPMVSFSRYGTVVTENGRVTKFEEKKYKENGNINGGVYAASMKLFDGMQLPLKFSFETDFMEKHIKEINIQALIQDSYFIDIGIPEDYERAQKELLNI